MDEHGMDTDHLLFTKASLAPTLVVACVTLLLLTVTTIDMIPDLADTRQFNSQTEDWVIAFDSAVVDDDGDGHTFVHTEIWADGETKVLDFDLEELDLPSDGKIGYISVNIIPEENTGISPSEPDWGCDSIGVTVLSDNDTLPGQWNDERNILLGNDADCEDIPLFVQTYPAYYDEVSTNASAKNAYQALVPWSEEGWGLGTLSIQIEIDVQSYGGQGVGIVDSDEEITVIVDVMSFTADVLEAEA